MTVNLYLHCTANAPRNKVVGFAFVLEAITQKGPATLSVKGVLHDKTKNQAEAETMAAALKRLTKPCELVIYGTQYQKNLITWLPEWEKNGWKNSKGEEIRPEYLELKNLLKPHKASVKTESHSYSEWLKRTAEEEAHEAINTDKH